MGATKVKKKGKTAEAASNRKRYSKGPEFLAKKLLPVFKGKDYIRYRSPPAQERKNK